MTLFVKARCNAPVDGGKCGQVITNAVCERIEVPGNGMFRSFIPGPTIQHLPCGHEWWRGQGWEPELERVPWAQD